MLMHRTSNLFIIHLHHRENMFVTFKYISVLKDLIAKENPGKQTRKVPFIPLATVFLQKTLVSFQLAF